MTFVRYVSIQLVAYAVDLGGFLIIFKSGIAGPIIANIFGKVGAGLFAFFSHRHFTFHGAAGAAMRRQAIRYFSLLAIYTPFSSALLALVLTAIKQPTVAKVIADISSVALTYSLSKYFIFRNDHRSASVSGGDDKEGA